MAVPIGNQMKKLEPYRCLTDNNIIKIKKITSLSTNVRSKK